MIERNYDNIPKELKGLKQWVCWKAVKEIEADGSEHYAKKLVNPYTGKWAKVNEPRDWAFFSIAKKTMEKYNYDGLSICLTNIQGEHIRNDIFCIDLDKVLFEPQKTEFIHFESSKIYEMFKGKTYIEYSMSGKGLHILGYGNLVEPYKKRKDVIEMYDKARFMSLTGVKTPGSTDSLAKLEDDVRMANKLYIGEIEPVKEKVVRGDLHESDAELIEKIRNSRQGKKFSALFDCGGVSGDDSVDDFNLCLILAFWTRCNESMMDRIFRQSALMRRKWDRPQSGGTYGSVTIANACKNSNAQRYNSKKN